MSKTGKKTTIMWYCLSVHSHSYKPLVSECN